MATLLNELTAGPLATELAPLIVGMNVNGIYAVLHRKDRIGKKPILSHDIKAFLSASGFMLPILDSPAASCRETVWNLSEFSSFDIRQPAYLAKLATILDGLVAETMIPDFQEPHKNYILSLGDATLSRIDEINSDLELAAISAKTEFVRFTPTLLDIYAAISTNSAFTTEILSSSVQAGGALLINARFTNGANSYDRSVQVFSPTESSIKEALLRERMLLETAASIVVTPGVISL